MITNPFQYSNKPQFFSFFRSLKNSKIQKSHENTYVRIFSEDICLGIMPIGGRSRSHPDFLIDIIGDKEDIEKAKNLLTSLASRRSSSTNELVCDVVENVVKNLTFNGVAYYEITQETAELFKLNNFTSKRLLNIFGLYFQFVPKIDRKFFKKSFVFKASKCVWKINIPDILGGTLGYRNLIFSLSKNSDIYPKCYDIEKISTQAEDFNFNEYVRQTKSYQYKLLELWGGTLRATSMEYFNEYYLVHRIVKFNRARTILREHVITELNNLIKRLEINAAIDVVGLPTVEFIDDQLKKLSEGELELSEAINITNAS